MKLPTVCTTTRDPATAVVVEAPPGAACSPTCRRPTAAELGGRAAQAGARAPERLTGRRRPHDGVPLLRAIPLERDLQPMLLVHLGRAFHEPQIAPLFWPAPVRCSPWCPAGCADRRRKTRMRSRTMGPPRVTSGCTFSRRFGGTPSTLLSLNRCGIRLNAADPCRSLPPLFGD